VTIAGAIRLVSLGIQVAFLAPVIQNKRPDANPPASVTPTLPTAQALVARHLAAIRATRSGKALRYARIEGVSETQGIPVATPFTLLRRYPNDFMFTVGVRGASQARSGAVGNVVWKIDPTGNAQVLSGPAAAIVRELRNIGSSMPDTIAWAAPTIVARAEFAGSPCYEVRLRSLGRFGMAIYFDVNTGLFAGHRFYAAPDSTKPLRETLYGDYFDFGFGKLARRTTNRSGTRETTLVIEKVLYNQENGTELELPSQVKDVLSKR
jgi:hypothetical protein